MLLHHKIKGSGEPVLLLHGLFGSLENLGTIANHLSEDFQVHSLDMRNHGRSGHHGDFSYGAMVDDILHYLDHQKLDQVRILGHSMGGKAAMQFALDYPDRVYQLIVADIAPVTYEHHHQDVFKGLAAVIPEQLNSRLEADKLMQPLITEPAVRSFILKNLQRSPEGFQWRLNLPVIKSQYANILKGQQGQAFNQPVLFIKGGNSPYIEAKHKTAILKLFPNAQVRVITDTGHWLHAEKPQIFSAIVKRFFNA